MALREQAIRTKAYYVWLNSDKELSDKECWALAEKFLDEEIRGLAEYLSGNPRDWRNDQDKWLSAERTVCNINMMGVNSYEYGKAKTRKKDTKHFDVNLWEDFCKSPTEGKCKSPLPGLEKLQSWMKNYGTDEDGFELKPDDSAWAMRTASMILEAGGGVPVEFELTSSGRPALIYSDIYFILCDLSVLVTFPGGKSLDLSKNMSRADIARILHINKN